MTEQVTGRQPAPSARDQGNSAYRPDELNADLGAQKMLSDMVNKLGTPTIITKRFSVWKGISESLTESGIYDASLRVALYRKVELNSVNVNGTYFERFWAAAMKPKYNIMGMPFGQQEEEKESLIGRAISWWRGGSGGGGEKNAGS